MVSYPNFSEAINETISVVKQAPIVKSGYWQGIDTSSRPEMAARELLNYTLKVKTAGVDNETLVKDIKPDLPWADDHFQERVSRQALNPPPSEAWWPYSPGGNTRFKNKTGKFSHTYPERYWPKLAGNGVSHVGIRFPYGDLDSLINLLKQDPFTRQAYLPIWFPEDLGAPITERKPCSLGYHFIMRDKNLHIVYFIRSCDLYRHFRNDIYLTVLLQHWVLNQLRELDKEWWPVIEGSFTMHITSLHLFVNDFKSV